MQILTKCHGSCSFEFSFISAEKSHKVNTCTIGAAVITCVTFVN